MSNNLADYYEEDWSEGGFRPTGGAFPELVAFVDQHSNRAAWLDVGCGDGMTAGILLRERGRDYIGVDVSRPAIEQALANGLVAREIEDAASLPFPESTFDAVLLIEVFEHLFEPNRAAAEVLRVLKPGGILFATVPNAAYWRRRLELLFLGRFDPLGDDRSISEPWRDPHIRFFTPKTLGRMLRQTGFEPVWSAGTPVPASRTSQSSAFASTAAPHLSTGGSNGGMPNLLGRRVIVNAFKPSAVERQCAGASLALA